MNFFFFLWWGLGNGKIQFWTCQLFVISGLPLLKIHWNNKLLMPATAEDRTSDSIEALGSGQLNQFRTWDLYFPSVCCISLSDIEKFSKGTSMGKMQNKLLPHSSHGCTADSFLIILILKMHEQGRRVLSCFKMVIIENETRSHMNKGWVLKRENKFAAAYEQLGNMLPIRCCLCWLRANAPHE